MRYLVMIAMVLGVSSMAAPAFADGCFLCEGGGYVAYTGDDTFEKRKQAKEQFGCTVSGTTSSCSNPKGSVSWLPQGVQRDAQACRHIEKVVGERG